eukprot:m.35790 g.35790  ORF g.35790 m.35790 type:complete len:406 (+) comp5326_c0_seq1:38-1255(+)
MGARGEEYVHFLKDQVHRLNVELRKLQYRPDAAGPAPTSPVPSFLVDAHNLPPLIHAYDKQLEEKTQEITTLRDQMGQLTSEIRRLVAHNDTLAEEAAQLRSTVDSGELDDMREHVGILMEENRLLLMQEKAALDQLRQSTAEAQNTSTTVNEAKQRASKLQAENNRLIHDMIELRKTLATVQRDRDTHAHDAQEAKRRLQLAEGKVLGLEQRLEQQTEMLGTIPSTATGQVPATDAGVDSPSRVRFNTTATEPVTPGGQASMSTFSQSRWTGIAAPLPAHLAGDSLHELTLRYRDLETEHQLAVTTIAELESQLTGSERQRKKLKKLIASLVESLTDTERTVVENQTELRVLTAEQRSKDKMLKTLLHQLDVSRQDAESTKRGATAMLAEATRIVEDRRGRRHR